MDRNSTNRGANTADALLQKLKDDLVQNASDKETIAAEEAAAKKNSVRRYRFRVMKKAEYLEKKRIADTLASAADEADISDEDLEALLRSYLKDTPKTKPVVENTAEIIAPEPDVSADIPNAPEDVLESEIQELPKFDLDLPLSRKEEPFFEESAPEDIPVETVPAEPVPEEEDDLLSEDDMLAALLDFGLADSTAANATTANTTAEEIAAPAPAAPETSEILPEDIDDDLAALLASIPDDEALFDEISGDGANNASAGLPDVSAVNDLPDTGLQTETAADDRMTDNIDALDDILGPLPAKDTASISDKELEAMLAAIESEDDALTADFTETDSAGTEDNGMKSFDFTEDTPEVAGDNADTVLSDAGISDDALSGDALSDTDLAAMLADIPDDLLDGIADESTSGNTATGTPDFDTPDAAEVSGTEEIIPDPAPAADTAIGTSADGEPEYDQTDLDLMIAFGMEDQLEKAVGREEAKKYKKAIGERGENHYNEMHAGDRPDTVQDKHAEYVSPAQNKEIFSEYKKKYGNMLFRFLGALFFLILLFFFENDKLLGISMPALFDREQYPLVYTLFDLQLVVLSGAMVWKGIRTGIRALLRLRPVPESITGFLFLACLVYTVIIAALCPMHGLQLYNFPIALAVLFELCYEFMNLRREIMSFKIVSSKKLKYAVDAIPQKDGEAERRMFAEYISDDPSLFRIKRTAFVESFFQRTETYPRTQRILRSIIPAVLLLTLAFFAADFILSGEVYDALTVAYITLLLTLPSCAFIMFSYPMYRASGFAYEKESAMIGEASLGEYADASVVTFDDKEVFPARGVRVRNVKVYGSNRIDHVIYAAASVFHVVGGPLSDVFETATGELGYAENVKLIRLDRDGIEARVDGGTVLAGRAAFVNRYGYNVSLSESEKSMEETGDACILYIAYENNIAAKLYIQYAVEPDFEAVLKQLYRQGICVGIKTSDPNIDDHLLSCKIKMSKYPVKIIKCAEPKETAIIVDRLSSGIVSKSGAKALLQTLAICDRVLSASRTNNVLGIVSILLGMAAMAFFVIAGMSITVAPLFIALYQLFWVIPVVVVARYYI